MTDRNTDHTTDGDDDEISESSDDVDEHDDDADVDEHDGDADAMDEPGQENGREDGFEQDNGTERADGFDREDDLVQDERDAGVGSIDPLGEPDLSVEDVHGEPPQYFEPADESTDDQPSSTGASLSELIGLESKAERSTDGDRVDVEPSTHPGLARARKVGKALDDAVTIPGTSFQIGLDPILGILPGAGDAVAGVGSLYIVLEAARADVPRSTLKKMLGLVAVDLVAGSVPVIGVLFDALWKANKWNVAAFEEHVQHDGR